MSKKNAELLFELGYKRPSYAEKVYPTDIYEYKGETWCVGGRIVTIIRSKLSWIGQGEGNLIMQQNRILHQKMQYQ